jgi:hypothetical protein
MAQAAAAAAMPPAIPDDPEQDFVHVLQHIIGLDTVAKRERVTVQAGVTTVENLLDVETDGLMECLTANTSIMAKQN